MVLFTPSFIGDNKYKFAIFLFVTISFLLAVCQVCLHATLEMKIKSVIVVCLLILYPIALVQSMSHFSLWCCVSEADFGRMCSLASRTIAILNRNNIPYWVCWGTLLGAVREKNMPFQAVPWEHDVDICVFESNWSEIDAALSSAEDVVFDEQKKVIYDTSLRTTMARAYVDVFMYTLSEDK